MVRAGIAILKLADRFEATPEFGKRGIHERHRGIERRFEKTRVHRVVIARYDDRDLWPELQRAPNGVGNVYFDGIDGGFEPGGIKAIRFREDAQQHLSESGGI